MYRIMTTRAQNSIKDAVAKTAPEGTAGMSKTLDLKAYLDDWAGGEAGRAEISATVVHLSEACILIAALVRQGALAGALGGVTGKQSGVDPQKEVDVLANTIVADTIKKAPVAWLASEELEEPQPVNAGAPLAVAIDPIDGSSNIDANA